MKDVQGVKATYKVAIMADLNAIIAEDSNGS